MIYITLQQIKDKDTCEDYQVLAGHMGEDFPVDKPFPMSEILDVKGFEAHPTENCAWAMQCLPDHSRMWRLYAVWCARQVQHLMTDDRSLAALDVAEKHANGRASDEELAAARDAAWAAGAASGDTGAAARDAAWAAWAASGDTGAAARDAARDAAWAASGDAARDAAWAAAWDAARDAQSNKLREILNAGEFK